MFEPPTGCKDLYEHTRILPIPGAIDDYNHHMGGVDIADQLRASFSTQQRGVKPWRPLFYWLLDTTIINAFRISEQQRKAKLGSGKDKVRSAHRAFREALVLELLKDPLLKAPKRSYVTRNTVLPNIRLTRPIGIHCRIPSKRAACIFCSWRQQTKKGIIVITKSNRVPRTRLICSHCNTPLCQECFIPFHYFVA
jgi:hypothetical protein